MVPPIFNLWGPGLHLEAPARASAVRAGVGVRKNGDDGRDRHPLTPQIESSCRQTPSPNTSDKSDASPPTQTPAPNFTVSMRAKARGNYEETAFTQWCWCFGPRKASTPRCQEPHDRHLPKAPGGRANQIRPASPEDEPSTPAMDGVVHQRV